MRIETAARAASLIYGVARWSTEQNSRKTCWLLPGNICEAVPLALISAGARIEFIDIDLQTCAIDLNLVETRLRGEKDIAGIVHAHPYGCLEHADEILTQLRILAAPDTLLIDDRCLCEPALEPPQSPADLVLYSTGHRKVLDLGGGGYAFATKDTEFPTPDLPCNRKAEAGLITALRQCEAQHKPLTAPLEQEIASWLPNTPGSDWMELSAQICAHLPTALEHTQRINAIYRAALPETICWPEPYQNWRFQIQTDNSDELLHKIRSAGFFASAHYGGFEHAFGPFDLPNTRAMQSRTVNLFNDENIAEDKAVELASLLSDDYETS